MLVSICDHERTRQPAASVMEPSQEAVKDRAEKTGRGGRRLREGLRGSMSSVTDSSGVALPRLGGQTHMFGPLGMGQMHALATGDSWRWMGSCFPALRNCSAEQDNIDQGGA